jgi:hypothetical protein
MKIPRDLSGAQLVKVLCRDWGYRVVHQEGATSFYKPTRRRISGFPFPIIIQFAL